MNVNHIKEKINYISDLFLDILIQNFGSLYEEIGEEEISNVEKDIRYKFRALINEKLESSEVIEIFNIFIKEEKDKYGLSPNERDIKWMLKDIFIDIGIEIGVETRLIRDAWKKYQVHEYETKIKSLKSNIENLELNIKNLERDLRKSEKKNKEYININIELKNNLEKEKKDKANLEIENINLNKLLKQEKEKYEDLSKLLKQEKEKYEDLNELLKQEREKYEDLSKLLKQEREKYEDLNELFKQERRKSERLNKFLKQQKEKNECSIKNEIDTTKMLEKIETLQKRLTKLQVENDDIKRKELSYKNKIKQLETGHENQIKKLELGYENQVKQLELGYKNQIRQLEGKIDKVKLESKKKAVDIKLLKEKYLGIYQELGRTLMNVVKSNKIIDGVSIINEANIIIKSKSSIDDINTVDELKDHLEENLKKIMMLDDLFYKNNIDNNLKICLKKLEDLRKKVI